MAKEVAMQHVLIVEDVPETTEWLAVVLQQAFGEMRLNAAITCQQAREMLGKISVNVAPPIRANLSP